MLPLTNGGHTPAGDGAVLAIKVISGVGHLDLRDKLAVKVDLLGQLDDSHVEGEVGEHPPELVLQKTIPHFNVI